MVHVGFNFSRRKASVSLSPHTHASSSFTTKISSLSLKRKSTMLFWAKISSQEVGGHGCLSECCELGKQRGEITTPKGIPRWHKDPLQPVSTPHFCLEVFSCPLGAARLYTGTAWSSSFQVGQGLEQTMVFPGISGLVLPLCSEQPGLCSAHT